MPGLAGWKRGLNRNGITSLAFLPAPLSTAQKDAAIALANSQIEQRRLLFEQNSNVLYPVLLKQLAYDDCE